MTVVATALLMILDIYNSSFSTFSGLFFLMAVSPLLVPLVFHISTAIREMYYDYRERANTL